MKATLYNQKGEQAGTFDLPDHIFNVRVNADAVHQAAVAHMANARHSIAHTKNRREVSGGGRKPWRQKGTGRARHGSIRSPLWKGGGVSFGPRSEKNFSVKINKKQKQKALFMMLSAKLKDAEIAFLDHFVFDAIKTKVMDGALRSILSSVFNKPYPKKTLVVMSTADKNVVLSSRNLPYATTVLAQSLNINDLLSHKYVVIPKDAVDVIASTYRKVGLVVVAKEKESPKEKVAVKKKKVASAKKKVSKVSAKKPMHPKKKPVAKKK